MMYQSLRTAAVLGATVFVTACADTGRDTGIDSHSLSGMQATIWVDPDGCKHWVIDDGLEGYMSPVLNLDGKPSCT